MIHSAPPDSGPALPVVDRMCMDVRRAHFPDQITFYAPGLKRYQTSEYAGHNAVEFVPVSVTGTGCALNCDHCQTAMLQGMISLPRSGRSLFDVCAALARRGTRGVLVSGGSDRQGRVPLLPHVPDMVRARRELGLAVRVHPGLPDDETCAALAGAGLDGAMVDIIGDRDTIRDVYHLDATPEDYERMLARLEAHGIPALPHIVLGLHYGEMRGERHALEMVVRHPPRLLVLVILVPLPETPMAAADPPALDEIGSFFAAARQALPSTPVILGCARPMGPAKAAIDTLAVDAGLNGIAYPADGTVAYARARGLTPTFINACCGMTWQ